MSHRRLLLALAVALSPLAVAGPARADVVSCVGAPGQVLSWSDAFGGTDAGSAVCVAQGARVVVSYGTSVVAGDVRLDGQLDVGGTATFASTTITSGSLHSAASAQAGAVSVVGDSPQPLVGAVSGTTLDVVGTDAAAQSSLSSAHFSGPCHLGSGTVTVTFLLQCSKIDVTRGTTVAGGHLASQSTVTVVAATLVVGDQAAPQGVKSLTIDGDLEVPVSDPPTEIHLAPYGGSALSNLASLTTLDLTGPATINARFVVDDDRFAGGQPPAGTTLLGVVTYSNLRQRPPIDVGTSTVESTGTAAWTGQLVRAVPGNDTGDTITFTRCTTAVGYTGPGLSGGGCGVARPVPVVIHQEVLPTSIERPRLTARSTLRRLRAGQRLMVFGQLTDGGHPLVHQRVVVRERTGGRTWLLKAVTTDRSGDWHTTLTFTRAGLFSATTSTAASPAVRVDRIPSAV